MIGHNCKIYKKCKVCGLVKWFQDFPSKGNGKRKSFCKSCTPNSNSVLLPSTVYKTDVSHLSNTGNIKVRLKIPSKRKIEYEVSFEQAAKLVDEGMAGIVHDRLIHKFYDEKTFRNLILKRDNNICYLCGKYGNTIDHIIPKSKGGITSLKNCVCACEKCNKRKGNLHLQQYLFYIEPLFPSDNLLEQRLEQYLDISLQLVDSLSLKNANAEFDRGSLESLLKKCKDIELYVKKLLENSNKESERIM
ncbi:HNH endonuclease [Thalassobacillus devorans]|uniref:HNH endonuclease n=1 Tax=Thalassobacillus devorans TaxID=279813 RepID=UPI001593A5B6|nr:HNH endonuclease [Thalassobacillus devorans]